MSWQAYVDQSLVGTGNIDKAVISDVSGKTIWAATPGFTISDAERKAIADSFSDKSDPKQIIVNGFHVNGEKYMTIDSTDESLKGKKGKEGLIAMKTTQALLIAHHPAEVQTTNAFSSVAELSDYLIKVGY
ncbi:Profilin/allergen [Lindgomyces ingoldianus]|uniref:Profilin/allergen n=1 Tax=Lindgomyces ingoldianus TaxID=673940 RepID=A0ACB6R161_9PLEO|nr:Profilin/allergen [Lindgomyces ingoldianus]KAF2473059.1 Profilin/allergen [Lindgomyces ingoldianus]